MAGTWSYFLSGYVLLNFFFALHIYFKSKKFYDPFYITSEGSTEKINLHEKYSVYRKSDSLSFFRIFIGLNLLFWVKFILLILTSITLIIFLG
jgi:hypothetical protein